MDTLKSIIDQFPILSNNSKEGKYVYFDNSATTQKPAYVIKAITDYYEITNSNVHRGIHKLSNHASVLYEKSHEIVADFINAEHDEVFFVKNCTEGLNLLALAFEDTQSFGLKKGDVIVTTEMEHHSNILPWMKLAHKKGLILEWIGVKDDYTLDVSHLKEIQKKHGDKVKIVTLSHVSNVLGVKNDIVEIIKLVHENNGLVVIDAAQSVAHLPIDVKELDIDFLVFSGHKIYGPMGSGAVFGKKRLLEKLTPVFVGGGIVTEVTKEGADWVDIPWRFEAGTPSVADAVGFAAAILWFGKTVCSLNSHENEKTNKVLNPLEDIYQYDGKLFDSKSILTGWGELINHENQLMKAAIQGLQSISGVKIFGSSDSSKRFGALSFIVEHVHPHDIASLLDEYGIAIRAGMHCAHPLHRRFGLNATSRISFGIYNSVEEVKYVTDTLSKVIELLI
jgi:cysteine desulfurase/selenocysteine lyase